MATVNAALDWFFPLLSSSLSFVFSGLLVRQWAQRRRPYQIVWALGLACYGVASGSELLGYGFGWSQTLYRAWYQFGAIMVAAYLGAGTVYLLRGSRFGYLVALATGFGAVPAVAGSFGLAGRGETRMAATTLAIGVLGLFAAIVIAFAQLYRPAWIGHVTFVSLAVGTLLTVPLVWGAPVDPNAMFDLSTGVVQGKGFPEDVRLVTPVFNIAGGSTLVLGALFSGWQYWRHRADGYRWVSNMLIALGGVIPSMTSSLSRFGFTGAFFVGELLGVVCIFAGFVVSTEVFAHRDRPARTSLSGSPRGAH